MQTVLEYTIFTRSLSSCGHILENTNGLDIYKYATNQNETNIFKRTTINKLAVRVHIVTVGQDARTHTRLMRN